jgi:ATP synthase protein I
VVNRRSTRKLVSRGKVWAELSIVGLQFPIAILIGYFAGRWLDAQLGTAPWLTLVFSGFGIAAGFVNLFRISARATEAEAMWQAEDAADADNASGGAREDDSD